MNIINFLHNQFRQVKEKGWVAIRRKARTTIKLTLAMPLILIVRLIRPFKLVRFGSLRSDILGHSVFDPEYYMSEKEVLGDNSLDLFYFQSNMHPNSFWPVMLTRSLRINPIYRYFDELNRLIPNGQINHKIPCTTTSSRDIHGYLAKTKTHVSFTKDEDVCGRKSSRASLALAIGLCCF